ncbi:MAG: S8 family serine peptidase, partial [Planctomycetes bacterium]|nr:S8 family serine peptidase [Planctomycetota bacterium]
TGITVLVYDGGTARASHDDFGGRLTVRDGSGMGDHPTHVSGTVGGDGSASGGQWAGMAPNVTIESYGFEWSFLPFFFADPGDIEDDYDEAINVFGAEIANNSIGTNTCGNGFDCEITGDYGVASSLIDAIVAGSLGEPMRIVWANGNERSCGSCTNQGGADNEGYHSTAPPACAKNQISVGALNSNDDSMTGFSSWGPCDDGRLRPDVSAPGCQSDGDGGVRSTSSANNTAYSTKCGTSMASPTVCGLSALLLQDYKAQFPGEPLPRNSMLKALLAHAALDLGNPGPDYAFGYGSVRIKDSIDVMRAENFLEKEVAQGEVLSALVLVSEGDTEVRVTISWDDVAGTPNIQDALINDLDLRLISPSQQVYFPWTLNPSEPGAPAVQTQPDHRNNTEQVFVSNPEVGAWRIEIEGFDVPDGPQNVSIVGTPALVNCSSSGVILMNAVLLGCSSIAEIQVIDCDLNTDDNKIETIEVNIASDTSPAGETVVLTEIDAATANFLGTIQLSTEDVEGMLQVSPNDTVTATYIDADDGVGGENVPVVFTATVDCDGPVITNIHVISVGATIATIGFDTDEAAVGKVNYGLACGLLFGLAQEENATTSHVVELTSLLFDSQYSFSVTAVDNQNNTSTDNNDGNCHTFTTPNVVFDFPFDANPGWSIEAQWGFGQPSGQGTKPGDPTGGHTGVNVYGYNLGGDYPNNLSVKYLTTSAIDCTGLLDVSLSFWRWLGVESNSNFDEASIEVSTDGSNWIPVWNATDTFDDVLDESWTLQEFNVAQVADQQPTVFFRWGMGPTDGDTTFAGWNIDDVQILANEGPIAIGAPQGVPEILLPGESAQVTVRIVEGTENLVADTGMLHYRTGGGEFISIPLTSLFEDFYEATLPAANCEETLEFYFSAEGDQSGVVTLPAGAPAETFVVAIGE